MEKGGLRSCITVSQMKTVEDVQFQIDTDEYLAIQRKRVIRNVTKSIEDCRILFWDATSAAK